MNVALLAQVDSGYKFEPETLKWITNIKANAGTISGKAIIGVDVSIKYLKINSRWSRVALFNPMLGDANAMKTSVVGANWTDGTTALNYATAWSESNGLTGDGAGWINSNWNQNTFGTTSNSICIYSRDSVGTGVGTMDYFGCFDGSSKRTNIQKNTTNGAEIILNTGTAVAASYNTVLTPAFWCGTRLASNDIRLYRNKTQVNNNSTATTTPYSWANLNGYILARNNNGTADNKANGLILAGILITHDGMTVDDVAVFYNAFKLWNDPVGRTGL